MFYIPPPQKHTLKIGGIPFLLNFLKKKIYIYKRVYRNSKKNPIVNKYVILYLDLYYIYIMIEEQLFQILKNKLFPDLLKAKNQMSRWDCYSPSKKYRIELKCRKVHYPSLLLEKKKFDAMLLESLKHNDIPLYINSTPKGIYIFNLLKINPIWEINSKNPATTNFGSYDRVEKEVCYLDIAEAKMLKFL